jgi:guanylate cyclase
MSFLRRLVSLGVTDELSASDAKHVRMVNIAALIVFAASLPWLLVGITSGRTDGLWQPLAQALVALPMLWLNHRDRHAAAVVWFQLTLTTSVIVGTVIWGAGGRTTLGALVLVPVPYLLLPRAQRHLAHPLAVVPIIVGATLEYFADDLPGRLSIVSLPVMRTGNTIIPGVALWTVAWLFSRQVSSTEERLDEERARADALLLNVLPPSIAQRLKDSPGDAIADKHDEVSVLFADVVGFTPLSATMTPARSVELLNGIFVAFDRICEDEGVEKVRTIGDGYMAVAGAPEPRADHASALVRVALAMQRVMADQDALEVRIGINSGEAVAAIVGTNRFHYDLWGDAVNVAARMESLGEPGRVHIARGTFERVKDDFACASRGRIEVKGKGQLETWFVEG